MNFGLSHFGLPHFGLSHALAVVALAGAPGLSTLALDLDNDQPATLEADDFVLDLETGVRTYRGNVVFRQGSLHLECDELVTDYNDDDKLDKGVCTGKPGKFRQRPQGGDADVFGRARSITLDRIEGVVIFDNHADIEQGGYRIHGRLITYDLATKKAKVTGHDRNKAVAETSAAEHADRPRLIIQPQKNQQN